MDVSRSTYVDYRLLVGKPEGMGLLGKPRGVDGRVISKWILQK
jgi:hypothetical protein